MMRSMRVFPLHFFKAHSFWHRIPSLLLVTLLVWSGACCEVLAVTPAHLSDEGATHQQMACHASSDASASHCDCIHPEKSVVVATELRSFDFSLPFAAYQGLFFTQKRAPVLPQLRLANAPRPPPAGVGPPPFYAFTVLLI